MLENSSVILVLCSRLCADGCKPFSPLEWTVMAERLMNEKKQPKDLMNFSNDDFKTYLNYNPEETDRVKRLLNRGSSLSFKLREYSAIGIKTVTRADPEYPKALKVRLKNNCPPLFYYSGDISIAGKRLVGFVGSREINADDEAFAATAVKKVLPLGYGIVSGGARGVDSVSSAAAVGSGGVCLEYIADSLMKKIRIKEALRAIQDKKLLVMTAVNPEMNFTAGNAMARNRFIYAQSEGTVVVKSDYNKGGTWGGATDAMKRRLCPIFCRNVPSYTGNTEMIKLGAFPIDDNWDGDVSAVDFCPNEEKKPQTDNSGVQMTLFDM